MVIMNPFENLSSKEILKLFDLLGVHIYTYQKNEEILPTIRNENIIGIVLSGYAQIVHIEYHGDIVILENLTKDHIFGTLVSATNTEMYQIVAKETTEVVVIDYDKLFYTQYLQYPYYTIFLRNLFGIINVKCKDKNERIQILEQKQIRNKLLKFFEIYDKKTRLHSIYLPFSFKQLADYLAVNRSSMFREIKNLKEEGFIEIKGRKITLLYK